MKQKPIGCWMICPIPARGRLGKSFTEGSYSAWSFIVTTSDPETSTIDDWISEEKLHTVRKSKRLNIADRIKLNEVHIVNWPSLEQS